NRSWPNTPPTWRRSTRTDRGSRNFTAYTCFSSMRKLLFLLLLALLLSACSKEPGEGGRAEIVGRVMTQNYQPNENDVAIGDPYPTPEHRVYIIYGDGNYHDDDIRTSADGGFRFSGLRPGTYQIYTVADRYRIHPGFPSGTEIVMRTVSIDDRKGTVDIGDLNIRRYRY